VLLVGFSPAPKSKAYRFVYSERCNMCDAAADQQILFGRRLDQRQGLWPRSKPGITTSIFRCRVCGLLYPNPMPIPESLAQHYDVTPEEYWVESYFRVEPDHLAGQISTFWRLFGGTPRPCSALDIGAGIGKAMVALQRAGFDCYGIEPSASFRQAAIERMGVQEKRVQLAAVENAAYPDDSFEFINFAAVVEHLADPAAALRKSVKWLKPGGLMYVEVPSSAFLLSRLVRLFYRLTLAGEYVINTCPMHVPYHLYEFGLESFRRHGARAGYTVAFHEFYPCAGYMPRWLIGPFNTLMRWTNTGMQLAVWIKKSDPTTGNAGSEEMARTTTSAGV
jgi:SAM-dependent methyltransferase